MKEVGYKMNKRIHFSCFLQVEGADVRPAADEDMAALP